MGANAMMIRWITVLLMLLMSSQVSANSGGEADFQAAQEKYQSGKFQEAASLLIKAVEQGHEVAQLPLAGMFRAGQGVKQNYAKALELFTRAAHQGYPAAQYAVGMMHRLGQGTETDYAEAYKWFERAASFGHAEAQNSLGVMYEVGRGVKVSYVTAVMWYSVASKSGSRRGRGNLNRLSKKLKAPDVAEANNLAVTCMRTQYKRCG